MKKVMKIIKPKPDPKQRLRDWQRKLRQECRNIERQIREERTVQKAIKEAAKRNDMVSAKALAKEIVSSRRTVNKLYENKAQMNSISMHLGESIGFAVMSRLARNRMQQPGYNLEGNSFDWDNIKM
ncbi:BnaC05g29160D [Brassica napus]|uniref:Uncharacterized protein n=3 Tax=Brassica TaxID=3705 RepID=A0A0D3CGW2_BRAOL|nr:hypothetical protein Bca52824_065412 [Brassica carinata]CAF1930817.1 unnamed protein product [Brassica napus]CDY29920.1 BnaC05g29160D [Brassica napus]